MEGETDILPGRANRHVVRLLDGTVLNRYWDERTGTSRQVLRRGRADRIAVRVALLRKSGGICVRPPSRAGILARVGSETEKAWQRYGHLPCYRPISTVCLSISNGHYPRDTSWLETTKLAAKYAQRAESRIKAIERFMWDAEDGVFTDYLWRKGRTTRNVTAATLYPLFLNVASSEQADMVAETTNTKLLQIGGIATTLVNSGQQWDQPNGWAPLQWIAVTGLRNYGFADIAHQVATRWVGENIAVYRNEAKLVEKYDVLSPDGNEGGGGEYATQIGFGWTNGVLLALGALYPELQAAIETATPKPQVASAP